MRMNCVRVYIILFNVKKQLKAGELIFTIDSIDSPSGGYRSLPFIFCFITGFLVSAVIGVWLAL